MNLLMFNLAVDNEHVTLAFGIKWIENLASRFDHVDVVTMRKGNYKLPSNVRVWSVGTENGYSKLFRFINFYLIVFRIIKIRKIDRVFTHMIPIFAVMFWPIAKLNRLKNVMWYAHGTAGKTLKLAHLLVDKIVTSTPEGCRINSNKIVVIGQGVDDSVFNFSSREPNKEFRLITVGRVSKSKNIELLINAFLTWKCDKDPRYTLTIVGAATSPEEAKYEILIKNKYLNNANANRIKFLGRMDSADIYALLKESDLFINLSETGSLDKAIIESMFSGCPVVSSNEAFKSIAIDNGFEECITELTVRSIQNTLNLFEQRGSCWIRTIVKKQYEFSKMHSLDKLMDRLCLVIDNI
jgi:glycosyltransferase involved in cell wall biosynthesis